MTKLRTGLKVWGRKGASDGCKFWWDRASHRAFLPAHFQLPQSHLTRRPSCSQNGSVVFGHCNCFSHVPWPGIEHQLCTGLCARLCAAWTPNEWHPALPIKSAHFSLPQACLVQLSLETSLHLPMLIRPFLWAQRCCQSGGSRHRKDAVPGGHGLARGHGSQKRVLSCPSF